jgi:hypothetical protein
VIYWILDFMIYRCLLSMWLSHLMIRFASQLEVFFLFFSIWILDFILFFSILLFNILLIESLTSYFVFVCLYKVILIHDTNLTR